MLKTCENCKKEYNVFPCHKDSKYCSKDCYISKRWGQKTCKFCNKKIIGRRYCNEKCQRGYWNINDYHLNKKKRIWDRKMEIINKLGGKCIKCGIDDFRILEINHIDRSKKKRPQNRQYNWTRRLKEWNENIDNLELLCANCHRLHTWEQMGYGKDVDPDYYKIAEARIEHCKVENKLL